MSGFKDLEITESEMTDILKSLVDQKKTKPDLADLVVDIFDTTEILENKHLCVDYLIKNSSLDTLADLLTNADNILDDSLVQKIGEFVISKDHDTTLFLLRNAEFAYLKILDPIVCRNQAQILEQIIKHFDDFSPNGTEDERTYALQMAVEAVFKKRKVSPK